MSRQLSLPDGFDASGLLATQKRLALGPFPSLSMAANREYATNAAVPWSDVNWHHGIARASPIMLVLNTSENQGRFGVGRTIRFANGEKRRILSSHEAGIFLQVGLQGDMLDSAQAGFPNKFEVIE